MAEVEIGSGKSGRRAYCFDDVAIVPSRRTRDPEDVDISWQLDAFRFDLPIMASPCDSVVSPATAAELARLGGVGVLHLEGLWTRYADPEPVFEEIASLPADKATERLQELYAAPVQSELVAARISELRSAGGAVAVAVTPQHTPELAPDILRAEPDLLVIQGTVVSAEHVSRSVEPLNLKDFIRHYEIPVVVGGCTSYQAALHLMRTGAAGVLVGAGSGAGGTNATRARRRSTHGDSDRRRSCGPHAPPRRDRRLRARHRRRGHDDRGRHRQGRGVRRRRGDDRDSIGLGNRSTRAWLPLGHDRCPPLPAARENECRSSPGAPSRRSSSGPPTSREAAATCSAGCGAPMALCGYDSLKEFQKADLVAVT